MTPLRSWWSSAARILPLAWPVFIGQLAVLAFATIDTLMVARHSAIDLAALAVGNAAYVSVFIGLTGVVQAVAPITGQLFGARQLPQAGQQLHQALWLALGLSFLGCSLLVFPAPFLALAQAPPDVAEKVRAHLGALAFALPSALLFTAFRGFNTAVSRPKMVMALQLVGLTLKVPLTALLVFGAALPLPAGWPWSEWRIPSLGTPGCGIATAIAMAVQLLVAAAVLLRSPFYAPFGLHTRRLQRPDPRKLAALLRLGVPMGLSIGIEVTGFTFMALFIARLGATPVAGHQIAVNLISVMFMLPISLGNATSTLVAQRIGAGDPLDARRLGWHGLQLAVLIAATLGASVYALRDAILHVYTNDAVIVAAALPLLAWVMLFHIADAAQIHVAYTLRAYRIASAPLIIYGIAIWGVGLGGGYTLAFDVTGFAPPALRGAPGFWAAATAGLTLAALGLAGFLGWMQRETASHQRTPRIDAHDSAS
ncbi:MAG TPA: MATE family efflux transporter [Burkholderiaceae bacterium]|nr:MATE family efflux transporter [Burkholderiaceae bacterium]